MFPIQKLEGEPTASMQAKKAYSQCEKAKLQKWLH